MNQLFCVGDSQWLMLPWNQVDWPDPKPIIYFIIGILVAALILRQAQKWWESRQAARGEKEQIVRLCYQHHLSRDEASFLAEALRDCPLGYPGLALVSRSYFDRFLSKLIADKRGLTASETLRSRLFGSMARSFVGRSPDYPDTRAIRKGESLRLHFAGFPGTVQGLVAQNDADSFSVVFPYDKDKHLSANPGDRVEGVFEDAETLLGLETSVLKLATGKLLVCELAHTEDIGELRHRESVRMELNQEVTLHFLTRETGGHGETAQGILAGMTLGECVISTASARAPGQGEQVRFATRLGHDRLFHLTGKIVETEAADNGQVKLHVKFTGLDDATRHDLSIALYGLRPRFKQT
jgi:hypothetical protein